MDGTYPKVVYLLKRLYSFSFIDDLNEIRYNPPDFENVWTSLVFAKKYIVQ